MLLFISQLINRFNTTIPFSFSVVYYLLSNNPFSSKFIYLHFSWCLLTSGGRKALPRFSPQLYLNFLLFWDQ